MKKICHYRKKPYPPKATSKTRINEVLKPEESKYFCIKHKQRGWATKKEHKRTCALSECGTRFTTKNRGRKFCSTSCSDKHRGKKALAREKRKELNRLKKAEYIPLGDGVFSFLDTALTLKNYKEPLTKIPREKGVGWYGTLAVSTDGRLVQCHLCGALRESLVGHIFQGHHMKMKEYREEFGLSSTTALVSEVTRMNLRDVEVQKLKNFTPEQKMAYVSRLKQNLSKGRTSRNAAGNYYPKKSLEQKNIEGICPEQLLDRIQKVALVLGHVPSKREFTIATGGQRYVHLIYKTYGGWEKAIQLCKFPEGIIDDRYERRALNHHGTYTDEELLEFLQIYARENNAIPTATDFKRDLLPGLSNYTRHFGGIENARRLAGVYEIVGSLEGIATHKSKYLRKST